MNRNNRRAMGSRRGAVIPERRLAHLPLFDGLDAATLAWICEGASELDAPRGTVIFRRGEVCRGLFVILEGEVKLLLHASRGAERVVDIVGPGGCLGTASLVLGYPNIFTAEAISDSRVLHLARMTSLDALERAPAFSRAIVSSLSQRIHRLMEVFEDCILRSGPERVATYLLNALPSGAEDGDGSLLLAVKKGIIASQLNLTQEHFSRILNELKSRGLIEVAGPRVHVPDIAKLRAYAAGVVAGD